MFAASCKWLFIGGQKMTFIKHVMLFALVVFSVVFSTLGLGSELTHGALHAPQEVTDIFASARRHRIPFLHPTVPFSDFILDSPQGLLDDLMRKDESKLYASLTPLRVHLDSEESEHLEDTIDALLLEVAQKNYDDALKSIANIKQMLTEADHSDNSQLKSLMEAMLGYLDKMKQDIQSWRKGSSDWN